MRRLDWKTVVYVAALAASLLVAVAAGWWFGPQVDNYAYDFIFRRYRPAPWKAESTLLTIDEPTLEAYGGMRGIRRALADGLNLIATAKPKAVAVDVLLADRADPAEDAALASAFRAVPNLVLSCELVDGGRRWEDPIGEFRRSAAALGHVHAEPDPGDNITRSLRLEEFVGKVHRWSLSLEAFRLSRGGGPITESPTDLEVGGTVIPLRQIESGFLPRTRLDAFGRGYFMRVRFTPPDMRIVPRISLAELLGHPERKPLFEGKVVFVGSTTLAQNDRIYTPYSHGATATGIEVNADAFETMAQGLFLTDVRYDEVLLFSLVLVALAGLAFYFIPGWLAYPVGALILAATFVTPYVFFAHQRVFPFSTPAFSAWLATIVAAAYQAFVVRGSLRRSEAERTRYQQAMHFVTHEMRTPLSAIQGSSELISRYPLAEDKRKQIADLINSESKRLARMIEIFLNVERLSAGHMELKHETIPVRQLVETCAARTGPLAERKHIAITLEPVPDGLELTGDRELMEYACYNLLTNAVKYSPQRTEVTVSVWKDGGRVRIAVKDQGIGMDSKEVKKIFQKFYRTKKAEQSGEAGTGIGLSIVSQIVEQHGGAIEVTSRPGAGSCFTLVLPVAARAQAAAQAERN